MKALTSLFALLVALLFSMAAMSATTVDRMDNGLQATSEGTQIHQYDDDDDDEEEDDYDEEDM